MFRCLWLRAPRTPPLATRLYQRTYGRTYGRRPSDADQPVALPAGLRLSEAPAAIAPASEAGAVVAHRAA